MTIFDYIVLAIIGLSILISLMRGGLREIFSLGGWLFAFYISRTYAAELAPLLPDAIPADSLKMIAAFIILYLIVLLLASLLSIALSTFIKKIGLGWMNRLLGGIFGLVRGLLIVCIIVMLAGMTNVPTDPRWQNAMFSSPVEQVVLLLMRYLPEGITKHVSFE